MPEELNPSRPKETMNEKYSGVAASEVLAPTESREKTIAKRRRSSIIVFMILNGPQVELRGNRLLKHLPIDIIIE